MRRPLTRCLLFSIALYRRLVSPLLVTCFGPCCRYTPSCSCYASIAIERFGPFRGSWFALRRVLRCHPWSSSGEDPVPFSLKAQS